MSAPSNTQHKLNDQQLQDMVAAADTGARSPRGLAGTLLLGIAGLWSLFQLWISSPLPYIAGLGVFNATEARSIHLAFAVFLGFLAFPALKRSPRQYIPLLDWILALTAAFTAAYLYLFYAELARRPSSPTSLDVGVAILGLLLLLEATRRALGPPLMIIAAAFILYSLAGPHMPGMLAHRGVSLTSLANHQWLSTQGVFGIALGVSTSFVFMFVLFGSLLDRAGAGNYFIKLAFSLLGHYRGGPAKASVVASGMTGLISGSSIANVVTTGTFTIPLMKRVGFSSEKAGAVEVAASVDGQLMPPVMGAAAFLMVEYVGIPYVEVIRHAFLPAIISYIALFYIVHLEAVKAGMQGLQSSNPPRPFLRKLLGFLTGALLLMSLSLLVYYGLGWLKPLLGSHALWIISAALFAIYLLLLKVAARYPDLEMDDPNNPSVVMPQTKPTLLTGLHFLLPVVVLVWCLMVERLSPGLSAFWASVFMIVIILTQRPLKALFKGDKQLFSALRLGMHDLWQGLVGGARNMIGIGIATATAGIIVGAVSQTGVGLVLADLVETLSMGNLMLMLVLTAIFSLVLGLGLPTTANYIVVSTLLAPVIVTLGEQSGLLVPLIAVHLFVFYFGLMADATPPAGLAAFAASAISGGSPIGTGVQAFYYCMRSAVLPFMFIFNTDLLLMNVDFWHGLLIFIIATSAMLIFAAATQNWLLVRSRWYESLILLLVAFTLFRPGFWMDMIHPPYESIPPSQLAQAFEQLPSDSHLRLYIEGEDGVGNPRNFYLEIPTPEGSSAEERLDSLGLVLIEERGNTLVDMVEYGSPAAALGLSFDQRIAEVLVPSQRWAKEWMWAPAVLLLGLVLGMQWRRRQSAAPRLAPGR